MSFPLKVVEAQPDPELNVPKTTEDALARLRLERVGLSERAGQIADVLSKLEAAEDREREAQAALGELGLAEVLDVKSWAAGGCAGPAPSPDMERRDRLNRKLGEALANVEASRVVAASLKDEGREVSAQLVALNEQLEALALDALSQRFVGEIAEIVKLGELVQARQAKTYGLTAFLRALAEKHQREGKNDKAVALFRRLESLAVSTAAPEFSPSIGAVTAAAAPWRQLYEEMK